MSDTKEFWAGQFGDQYLARCRVDWRARIPFWKQIMDITGARSVHEYGCNCGWNLSAIKRAYHDVRVSGNDVNYKAVQQAQLSGLHSVAHGGIELFITGFELVFTAGVLIHVAPEDLQAAMQSIIDASCDYVLAVEYAAEQEEEVLYRGHEGKLWKRDYGKLYQDLGLELVDTGNVGKEQGFDSCVYWLLRQYHAGCTI